MRISKSLFATLCVVTLFGCGARTGLIVPPPRDMHSPIPSCTATVPQLQFELTFEAGSRPYPDVSRVDWIIYTKCKRTDGIAGNYTESAEVQQQHYGEIALIRSSGPATGTFTLSDVYTQRGGEFRFGFINAPQGVWCVEPIVRFRDGTSAVLHPNYSAEGRVSTVQRIETPSAITSFNFKVSQRDGGRNAIYPQFAPYSRGCTP